ncbi:hypothetical protein BMS3Bbin01_02323 [bacterium BMS3Bbin01]|nr:hypothetical protein BMS3Bbin01_02323 [bacterium BMS3Bbin01]
MRRTIVVLVGLAMVIATMAAPALASISCGPDKGVQIWTSSTADAYHIWTAFGQVHSRIYLDPGYRQTDTHVTSVSSVLYGSVSGQWFGGTFCATTWIINSLEQ